MSNGMEIPGRPGYELHSDGTVYSLKTKRKLKPHIYHGNSGCVAKYMFSTCVTVKGARKTTRTETVSLRRLMVSVFGEYPSSWDDDYLWSLREASEDRSHGVKEGAGYVVPIKNRCVDCGRVTRNRRCSKHHKIWIEKWEADGNTYEDRRRKNNSFKST